MPPLTAHLSPGRRLFGWLQERNSDALRNRICIAQTAAGKRDLEFFATHSANQILRSDTSTAGCCELPEDLVTGRMSMRSLIDLKPSRSKEARDHGIFLA